MSLRHCHWCVVSRLAVSFRAGRRLSTLVPIVTRNVVDVPDKQSRRLQVVAKAEETALAQRSSEQDSSRPLIISCKRDEYNHYRGQTYQSFTTSFLASQGWKHRRSKGDHFTINSFGPNPSHQSDHLYKSFEDLQLSAALIHLLRRCGISEPTRVQAEAIPVVQSGSDTLITSESGSGKTLAFVLPIVQQLFETQLSGIKTEQRLNTPRYVILTPSRELVSQIESGMRPFLEVLGAKYHALMGGHQTKSKLAYPRKEPIEVLISTPGVLHKLLAHKIYSLARVRMLVLDEADSLLDDSFYPVVQPLLSARPSDGQLVLVSSTHPRGLDDLVNMHSMHVIRSSRLHQPSPHITHRFLRIGKKNRPDKLLELAQDVVRRRVPTIVFCNKASTTHWGAFFLEDHGLSSVYVNGSLPDVIRQKHLKAFANGETDILFATDIVSRGWDTPWVQHVINLEFPQFISDFIHRCGRVGRINSVSHGLVTSMVSTPYDVELVWNIESAVRRNMPLENVNANITRKLAAKYWPEGDKDENTTDNATAMNAI